MKRDFKEGEAVVFIGMEGEPKHYEKYLNKVGQVSTIYKNITTISIGGGHISPYSFNLKPTKSYYIQQFKKDYQKVNQ